MSKHDPKAFLTYLITIGFLASMISLMFLEKALDREIMNAILGMFTVELKTIILYWFRDGNEKK